MEPNNETAFGLSLVVIGITCAAYEYVPFYGATPLALGLSFVAMSALWSWMVRKARS